MNSVFIVDKYWLHQVQCRMQHLQGRIFLILSLTSQGAVVFHTTSNICLPADFINLLNQQEEIATLFYLI